MRASLAHPSHRSHGVDHFVVKSMNSSMELFEFLAANTNLVGIKAFYSSKQVTYSGAWLEDHNKAKLD